MTDYKIIDLNEENFEEYDLFCYKSKKKSENYQNKVKWVKQRFKEGIKLKILYVDEGAKRGFTSRGFIEYIPGEYAWRGISAAGYMVIHCLWVVGKHKKQGYGTKLLEECMSDAKDINGIAVITSEKSWLPGRKLFVKHGFEKVDTYNQHLELHVKRFKENAPLPKFIPDSQKNLDDQFDGLTVYKSNQCPYLDNMVASIEKIAEKANIPMQVKNIQNYNDAQTCPHPYGTFCVVLNGKPIMYELHPKKLVKLLTKRGITGI